MQNKISLLEGTDAEWIMDRPKQKPAKRGFWWLILPLLALITLLVVNHNLQNENQALKAQLATVTAQTVMDFELGTNYRLLSQHPAKMADGSDGYMLIMGYPMAKGTVRPVVVQVSKYAFAYDYKSLPAGFAVYRLKSGKKMLFVHPKRLYNESPKTRYTN